MTISCPTLLSQVMSSKQQLDLMFPFSPIHKGNVGWYNDLYCDSSLLHFNMGLVVLKVLMKSFDRLATRLSKGITYCYTRITLGCVSLH